MVEYEITYQPGLPFFHGEPLLPSFYKICQSGEQFDSNVEYFKAVNEVTSYIYIQDQRRYSDSTLQLQPSLIPNELIPISLPQELIEKATSLALRNGWTKEDLPFDDEESLELFLDSQCDCIGEGCTCNCEACSLVAGPCSKVSDGGFSGDYSISCGNCGGATRCEECQDISIWLNHVDHTCSQECCARGHTVERWISMDELKNMLTPAVRTQTLFGNSDYIIEQIVLNHPTDEEIELEKWCLPPGIDLEYEGIGKTTHSKERGGYFQLYMNMNGKEKDWIAV